MIKELTTQLQESIDRDINNLVIRDNLDENENENENDSEHGERAEKDENGNDREMDDDRERAERDDDGDGDGREIEIEGGVNKLLGFFENNDIFNLPNNIGQLEAVIEGGTKDFAKLLENQDFNRLIDEFGLPTGDELLAKLKQDEFEIEREITLANGDTFGIELEGGEGGFELNLIAENEKPRLPIVPPKDPIPDIGFTIIDFTFDENIPFVGGTNIKLGLAVKNTTKPGGIGRGFEGSLGGLLVLGVTTPQGNIYGGLVDAKLKLKLKPGTFQPENVKLSGGSGAILGKTEDKLGTYLENLPLPGIVKDFLRKAQELADTEINVTETTSYSLIGEAEADFSGLVPITKGGFGIRVERVGSARGTLQGGFLEFSYKVKGQVCPLNSNIA